MNPIYTGCGVSFIDLKLAQRLAETRLRDAEGLSVLAAAGARGSRGHEHPASIIERAWRQMDFNAHHDGVTGSMSDQVIST
jgi:alpha-mannosidase